MFPVLYITSLLFILKLLLCTGPGMNHSCFSLFLLHLSPISRTKLPTQENIELLELTRAWLPGGSVNKEITCSAGDLGSIPGSGRYPGEGNDNPLQYSCLENSMDREAWWAVAVHGVIKSQTRLSD